jgi:hypothetical protein
MSHRLMLPVALILTLFALAVTLVAATSHSTHSAPKVAGFAASTGSTDGPPTCCVG